MTTTDKPKKPEVKTVDLDTENVHQLMVLAEAATGFPKYVGIREAVDRQLQKIEQDLEEKLEKVHEDEAKEKLEAEAKARTEAAKAKAEEAAKAKAEEAKSASPPPASQYPTEADAAKGARK